MALSASEQRVCAILLNRKDALLADLRRWVAIPTGHANHPGLDEQRGIIVDRLARLGAACELIPGAPRPDWLREGSAKLTAPPPTAICRRRRESAPSILLCGHIDTVHDPMGNFRELSVDAAADRAVGPGCADMKGGLLVALAALEAMEEAGTVVSWSFILNSDEESGSFCSEQAIRREGEAGYTAGLVFEPALPDGSLVVERPGSGQFMIQCRGRAAHVGRDFTHGVSAVGALAEAIGKALALADPAQGCIVNVGPLEGGSATNIVPDRACAWGNVRYFSRAAEQHLAEQLDALQSNQGRLPEVLVRRIFNRPAKPQTPAVARLATQARQAAQDLGSALPFATTGGVCDGNNLQAAGLPVIDTLGVRGGGLHTSDEWIDLRSLVDRAQLAAVLMMRLTH